MKIGVSGKSGSGKSSVSRYISKALNFTLIDLDIVSKNIRNEYKNEIQKLVNEDIIVDGEIDSKKLGSILFENKDMMNKYNLFIYERQKEILEEYKNEDIVIDSMFLPIMDIFNDLDVKIFVTCKDEIREKRVTSRDNITREYFLSRDKNSLNYDVTLFDYVINNDIEYLEQTNEIISKIKK